MNPDSRRALLQRCALLLELHRRDEAARLDLNIQDPKHNFDPKKLRDIGDLDARIDANPKDVNGLLFDRAVKCNEIDQYTLSLLDLAVIKRSGSGDPNYSKALAEEGYALQKLGQSEKAMADFTEATTLDPKNALGWRFRGEAEMLRADYPQAIDFLSKSLALEELAPVLLERARCYRSSGHTDEAAWDVNRYHDLQK